MNTVVVFLRRHSAAVVWLTTVVLIACFISTAQAETLRKRYTLPYDRATRRASSVAAASESRKRLVRDFLGTKFSAEIINRFAEDIDVALDPPDDFLTSFNVVSEKVNEDETQVTLTVEGEFDFASIVSALVQNKILSFGQRPPKVMVMPSSRFQDPRTAKTLRAMIYDKIKQAGLQPIAFESVTDSLNFRLREKVTPTSLDRDVLIRTAKQYGADYLIYIDTEVEVNPYSGGGYIVDANFIHSILRPNGGLILGESLVSERGNGSSAMIAFQRALDSVAPAIARVAIGQLYESIYSDSDVVYDRPQLKEEKEIVINFGSAQLVQTVIARLEKTGATAKLGTGMSSVSSRVKIETSMDDLDLYQWFNSQTFTADGKTFRTPVVAYAENRIEVEAVAGPQTPHRAAITQPPPRRKRSTPSSPPAGIDPIAKVVLKLRPPTFNK